MAVRIRMKRMGRKHRSFFRICATDSRSPRDGRVIEELGAYDPSVPDTDARTSFNFERLQYWLGVGALPSERVRVLIKKYGPGGSHVDHQKSAVERLRAPKSVPDPGAPKYVKQDKSAQEAAAESAPSESAPSEPAPAEAQVAEPGVAETAPPAE